MTTSLALRSPEALVASLPYLLGFEPHASAVILWLRRGRLLLTQRLDLPRDPVDPAWHEVAWAHDAARSADQIVMALVSARPDLVPLVARLRERADEAGLEVLDVVQCDQGRWRSLLCCDEDCCPKQGRVVPDDVRTAVAAEFAWAGVAPYPERAELVRSLDRDDERAAAVAHESATGPGDQDDWRDAAIREVLQILSRTGVVTDTQAAMAVAAMSDIRVRDTLLWEVGRWPIDQVEQALVPLAQLVRAAPPGALAPVGTLYAGLAWLAGDGARAGIALDRVMAEDPDYSLAQLLVAAVRGGLSPETWRQAMGELTRDECRYGAAPSGRPPA